MIKKLSLGKKLMAFSALFAVAIAIGTFVGWYAVRIVDTNAREISYEEYPAADALMESEIELQALIAKINGLFNTWNTSDIEKIGREVEQVYIPGVYEKITELESYSSKFSEGQTQQVIRDIREIVRLAGQAEAIQHRMHQYSYNDQGETNPLYLGLSARLLDHNIWLRELQSAIANDVTFTGETDPKLCKFGKFLSRYTVNNPEMEQYLPEIKEAHKKLHHSAIQVTNLQGSREQKLSVYEQQAVPAYETIDAAFRKVIRASRQQYNAAEQEKKSLVETFDRKAHSVASALKSLEGGIEDQIDELLGENSKFVGVVNRYLLVAGSIAVVFCLLLGWFLSKSITKPIQITIRKLIKSSESTGQGSKQISSASIELAEGASEQASAIEETSASLEQINAMAQQNTTSAQQATALSKETNDATNAGLTTMSEMQYSIEKVRESAQESSRIISTIDEIAFQTNLLALNAAVEAARAGEAGQGFAVVADEVRNLAQRAAEAASNTAELLEGSLKNTEQSVEIVGKMADEIENIGSRASKVNELVEEIALASNEQSEGINQLSAAISQIDQVTQGNAANAEETSSSAEHLQNQSDRLLEIVDTLTRIIYGW